MAISKFTTVYAGHIDFPDHGQDAPPANERRFSDGLTRYELADESSHHDHLICVECHTITEFEEPRIEELQEKVARKYGFELRSHKHELYGVCAACQKIRRVGN